MKRMLTAAVLSFAASLAAASAPPVDLWEMELEARTFDPAWLEGLGWFEVEPLEAEAIGRDVVLMVFWDVDEARSVRALPAAKRLSERYPGLRVLGVHGSDGAAEAGGRAEKFGVASAVDMKGLGSTLGIGRTPMFVLVDRAGAIREVTDEQVWLAPAVNAASREDAAASLAALDARRAALEEARTAAARVAEAPAADPAAPGAGGARPDEAAYRAARWPVHNEAKALNALNFQGKALPEKLGGETWLTPKPDQPLDERVLVLDFWAVWCGPCLRASPTLDALQKQYEDELYVIGVAGQNEGEQRVRDYIAGHPVSYHHVFDAKQTLYRKLNVRAIPHVAIVSTDGVIRWQGNPHAGSFRKALREVIEADPLLASRR